MANTVFPSTWQQYPIKDFSGGLNVDTSVVNPNELTVAENVDLQKYGAVVKRGGYRKCHTSARTVTAANGGINRLFNYSKNSGGVLTETLLFAHDGKIVKAVPQSSPTADKLTFASFTDLTTGLTTTDKFSMATLANKCIISSLNSRLWTNGTTVYNNGVAAPAAPAVTVVGSGGVLTAGTYQVAVAYVTSGNYEYVTNMSILTPTVVSVGSSHLHVDVVASADPQIDKVRIYLSSPGGSVMYYQSEVANTNATIDVGTSTPLAGAVGETDNAVPPKAKWVVSAGNRIFYVHTDDAVIGSSTVKWSHVDDPHSIGALNVAKFSAEDGEVITGAGLMLNYLVVFKRNAIFFLDIYEFTVINFSYKEGCICHDSIQTVYNGKALVFASDGGIKMLDGSATASMSKLKVDTLVCKGMNQLLVDDNTSSMYSPSDKVYSICYPSASGGYTWLNYYFDDQGWSAYLMQNATAFCVTSDQSGNIVPLYAYYSSTSAYICQSNYGSSDAGDAICMRIRTVPSDFGMTGVTKCSRGAFVEWTAAAYTTANLEVIVDFGTQSGVVKKIIHDGSSFWGYFDWGHGYWGQSGRAVDRIDLKGKGQNFEFVFTETSTVAATLYGMTILYYPVSYQGVPDAQ
jgi:hypothetical protein